MRKRLKTIVILSVVIMGLLCFTACSDCGNNSHAHVYDNVVITKEPTCTERGEMTISCVCGEEIKQTIPPLRHDYLAETVAPCCTECGFTIYTCMRCGDTYTDDYIEKLGHDYLSEIIAPSCVEQGFTIYTCTMCGDTYVGDYLPAFGHDYLSQITAPTCTEEGFTVFTCTRCGDSYTDNYLPALGHDYLSRITAPTCTEEGFTVFTCTRCGDSYTDNYLPALGHDYLSQITASTCTEEGFTVFTCTRCGDSYTDNYLPALGHDYQNEVAAPTCTEQGYTIHICSSCKDMYKNDFVDALGHDYKWSITKEPSESEEGIEIGICSNCGNVIMRSIPVLEHEHVYDTSKILPSCTEQGYVIYTCSTCGYTYRTDFVDALGHDYETQITAPTCTEHGFTTYTCLRCEYTYVGDDVVALGHDYQSQIVTPTCTEQGYTIHTCSRCGDSYKDDYVEILGHDYLYLADSFDEATIKAQFQCARCGVIITNKVDVDVQHTYSCCQVYTANVPNGIGGLKKISFIRNADYYHTIGTYDFAEILVKPYSESVNNVEERSEALDYFIENGTLCFTGEAPANCMTNAFAVFTCNVCRQSIVIKVFGDHTFDDQAVHNRGNEATCLNGGYKERYCTTCKEWLLTDEIGALGHDYGEWTVDGAYAYAKELGGTVFLNDYNVGRAKAVCSRCGEEICTEEYNYDIISTELPTANKDGEMVVYYYFDIYLVAKATIPIILIK